MLTGIMWNNDNPAREFYWLAECTRFGSKAVWLIEKIPARELLIGPPSVLDWLEGCVWLIEENFCVRKGKTKIWRFIIRQQI